MKKEYFSQLFIICLLALNHGSIQAHNDFKNQLAIGDTAHLIILLGQSNAMGSGPRTDLKPTEIRKHPRIKIIAPWTSGFEVYEPAHPEKSWVGNSRGWHPQSPDHLPINNAIGFGIELSLCNNMLQDSDTIYLLKHTISASGFQKHWQKDSLAYQSLDSIYNDAIQYLKQTHDEVIVEMVIWCQGESDANTEDKADFYTRQFSNFVMDLINRYATENSALIIPTINDQVYPYADIIRKVHKDHAAANKFSYFVEVNDLEYHNDSVHIAGSGLRVLGERIYQVFKNHKQNLE